MEAEFAREILSRLPLAEAVLSLWRWGSRSVVFAVGVCSASEAGVRERDQL